MLIGKNQLYPILMIDPSFCLSWWVEQEKKQYPTINIYA